mgnify:CR=1 FL=1
MSVFLAALHLVVPHYSVRGHTLLLSQGHPFSRVEIDLRRVAGAQTTQTINDSAPSIQWPLGKLLDGGVSLG